MLHGSTGGDVIIKRHCNALTSEKTFRYLRRSACGLVESIKRTSAPLRCREWSDEQALHTLLPVEDVVITVSVGVPPMEVAQVKKGLGALRRMRGLLIPFFRQWRSMRRLEHWSRDLTAALEHSDTATLLLDRNAGIRYANGAARRALDQQDGLQSSFDRLAGNSLKDTVRVRTAIDHVLSSESSDDGVCPVLTLSRTNKRPLLVAVTSAKTHEPTDAEPVVAIAYVFDPEQDLTEIVEPACRIYGLSPSETKLTCLLVNGQTLSEAAKVMKLREQSARSYLKQVFFKTDTNRQAELVQLMSKSSIRMATRGRKQAISVA